MANVSSEISMLNNSFNFRFSNYKLTAVQELIKL
jgi:hypothetical protein